MTNPNEKVLEYNKSRLPRWRGRKVIAYTPSIQNLGLLIRDVFLRNGWELDSVVSTHAEVIEAIAHGRANLILFEGTSIHDVYDFLRLQINHPLAMLTPTFLALADLNEFDELCISSIGQPVLSPAPLSVHKIVEALGRLHGRWTSGPFPKLSQAFELLREGKQRSAYKILLEEFRKNVATPLVANAISLHFREQYNYKVAEKILISCLQKAPKNMGIYASLIDLYMNASAPSKALYFINKANKLFGNPTFLCHDAAQVYLMTNKLKEALPYLRQLQRSGSGHLTVRKILPRICFATGEFDEFDHLVHYRYDKLESYQKVWKILSQEQMDSKKEVYKQIIDQKKIGSTPGRAS